MTIGAILDTNIVIYLITNHPTLAQKAQAAMREIVERGQALYLPASVVAEIVYVFEGKSFSYTRSEAAQALERFILNSSIECQDETAVLYALEVHRDDGLDFVDGYCAGLAKERGIALITADRELSNKTDAFVKRI